MNLGVYIPAKNDDIFIADVIKPVLEVFPEVQFIDLGSVDKTVQIAKSMGLPVNVHEGLDGLAYKKLLNHYSRKHDWVIWIDSDEIFPVECLHKLKELIKEGEHGQYKTVRASWKKIKQEADGLYVDKKLRMSGHKAFDTKVFNFANPWPYESLSPLVEGGLVFREPKIYNGVWCWHAVLMQRSSVMEDDIRRNKRLEKTEIYNRELEWEKVDKLPWLL